MIKVALMIVVFLQRAVASVRVLGKMISAHVVFCFLNLISCIYLLFNGSIFDN